MDENKSMRLFVTTERRKMMRKQTDLSDLKQTAHALLYTEIYATEFSSIIVTHPFTDSGITTLSDGNGGMELLNLMENEDGQNQ